MNTHPHFPHNREDWSEDEEYLHLSWREKSALYAIVGGMGFLLLLILIGIGF
ncbi:MAG: hypothetical protein AAFX93_05570 [Verrucomicrobiota bacterium]